MAVADFASRRKTDDEAITELLKKNEALLAIYDLTWQDYHVPSITMPPLVKSLGQKCAKDPAVWDAAIKAGLQVKNPLPDPQP